MIFFCKGLSNPFFWENEMSETVARDEFKETRYELG